MTSDLTVWQAIVLGLVQGATEFIPVSSSGHLVLVPWLLGWVTPGLVFDTTVHWGTLVAVLIVFWRDLLRLAMAWIRSLSPRSPTNVHARLAWWILIGTIPAVLAGYSLEDWFEKLFAWPGAVGGFLLVTAAILVLSERFHMTGRSLAGLRVGDALFIGVAQAFAIAPGISRSGATIAAGLLRGLERDVAARYSFLLAIPIIFGAGLLKLKGLLDVGVAPDQALVLLIGFVTAAVSGWACIRFLLSYLQRGRLYVFAAYCATIGIAALVLVSVH